MAIVHEATITPSKQEIVTGWLDRQPWGGTGAVKLLGSYRFDGPGWRGGHRGAIGGSCGTVLHVPLSYRAAELARGEKSFVARMQHSVLGDRWVYDGTGAVAVDCFVRALRGEQEQAAVEVWDGDTLVEHREPIVRVLVHSGPDVSGWDAEDISVVETAGQRVAIGQVVGTTLEGPGQLIVAWPGGSGEVTALAGPTR